MKKNICIVEDDSDIRELISYILVDDRYDVNMCASVKEFFDLMKNNTLPDIMVFDIMLPDGNGIELCKQMKVKELTSDIPILLMSAHYKIGTPEKAGCADAFISKPFDIDLFKDKVEAFLIP
jgi:DNA-binding response OmpR family regulator